MRTINFKKLGLIALIGISISCGALAGGGDHNLGIETNLKLHPKLRDRRQKPDEVALTDLGPNLVRRILGDLSLAQMREDRRVCTEFRDDMPFANGVRARKARDIGFKALEAQFIPIPAGQLPNGNHIGAFDTVPAIDRQTWEAFMGGPPKEFPKDGDPNYRGSNWKWENCPTCPVTHVAWEEGAPAYTPAEVQKFIQLYNAEAKRHPELIPPGKKECIYAAGSEDQRLYANLGDPTGANHEYMLGEGGVEVTAANADEYFWHSGNSNTDGTGNQIQPLGTKKKNAYGLERPPVWIMAETLYSQDPERRSWGRAIRGGSWSFVVGSAGSAKRNRAYAGDRNPYLGFSVTRTCF